MEDSIASREVPSPTSEVASCPPPHWALGSDYSTKFDSEASS